MEVEVGQPGQQEGAATGGSARQGSSSSCLLALASNLVVTREMKL